MITLFYLCLETRLFCNVGQNETMDFIFHNTNTELIKAIPIALFIFNPLFIFIHYGVLVPVPI